MKLKIERGPAILARVMSKACKGEGKQSAKLPNRKVIHLDLRPANPCLSVAAQLWDVTEVVDTPSVRERRPAQTLLLVTETED